MADRQGDVTAGSVRLVQTGGFAGLKMSASMELSDLPAATADRTRGLAEQVLAEQRAEAATRATPVYDGMEYQLYISLGSGLSPTPVVAHDGALTPAQQDLIDVLRPHLSPE